MRALLTGVALFWAGAAGAADVALIIGNEDYRRLADVRSADDVMAPGEALERQGFEVIALANADTAGMARALARFVDRADGAERIAVVLNGHFVSSATDAWLLPVDVPESASLADMPRIGLPLSIVHAVLERHPGRAVLVIGHAGTSGSAGTYLARGPGEVAAGQGVTLVEGDAASASWFVSTVLIRPGIRLAEAVKRLSGIMASGYLPADYVFLAAAAPAPSPDPVPLPDADAETEAKFWNATRSADTIAAYEAYLRRYPEGPHAEEARRIVTEIRTDPNRPARLAEDALRLSRDQRREIQRGLSLLGFDPRGIDGVFGQGSRRAIAAWQTGEGVAATGYLTREQIAELARQADIRAAELEREAEVRRLEQERQDRAYWAATGSVGDEAGLRAYLGRYPDGIFAELAQSRLKAIEDAKRAEAAQQDRAAWDRAVGSNTIVAYRLYLQEFPRGAFAEEAQARIDDLTAEAEQSETIAEAAAREEALQLNDQTRLLIERRLDALDLKPGEVDGTFDNRTRRAIRRYQQARDIGPTGYLDEVTVVRILADAILR
jgi:peptidoglycan hydrolase-like protein with peptidoglycan-binding domain